MKNPDQFCINCDHAWGVDEEICPKCGFDPVNNSEDEDRNNRAYIAYMAFKSTQSESAS